MAGFVIENLIEGNAEQIHWEALNSLPENAFLLDVRTQEEYSMGYLADSHHIPVDELRERISELPTDQPLYIFCQSGLRSYLACRILKQEGYTCFNIAGGYGFYEQSLQNAAPRPEGTGPCGLKS